MTIPRPLHPSKSELKSTASPSRGGVILRLRGKVAIIIGARSDIGQAIAERQGCDGAKEIVDYVGSVDGAKQTERVIEQFGGVGGILRADITRASDVRAPLDKIPLGCPGKPEDVASVVILLALGDVAYLTGTTFVVDGGLVRRYREQ